MVEYTKQWLSVQQQIDLLAEKGVEIGDRDRAETLLKAIGYYRLTGYLYPFRESEPSDEGDRSVRVTDRYMPGTTLQRAEEILDFDRSLRTLVMEGAERIEVAVRMQIGHILGRRSPFAHEEPDSFCQDFTAGPTDSDAPEQSQYDEWLEKARDRVKNSSELFVMHFRDKYDGRMPIWAVTELFELGQLSRLYDKGLKQEDSAEIALALGVPMKKTLATWLASLNYVRNVAAHHARLFNRRLQFAPSRPKKGEIPLLDHMRAENTPERKFGVYNVLAVIAYLLRHIDSRCDWAQRLSELLRAFPTSHALTVASMGVPDDWESLELWHGIGEQGRSVAADPLGRDQG